MCVFVCVCACVSVCVCVCLCDCVCVGVYVCVFPVTAVSCKHYTVFGRRVMPIVFLGFEGNEIDYTMNTYILNIIWVDNV